MGESEVTDKHVAGGRCKFLSFYVRHYRFDCTNAAKMLIRLGADYKLCNSYGQTPLHFSARRANEELCRLLLTFKDIDVNIFDHGDVSMKY